MNLLESGAACELIKAYKMMRQHYSSNYKHLNIGVLGA